jgi:hypothetical protein
MKTSDKAEHTAMYLRKSWGRKGKKGYYKTLASRATRRAGKAVCKDAR